MRPDSFEQARLDTPTIAALPIDLTCRDEFVPITKALQYLHSQDDLFSQWTLIISEAIREQKNADGKSDRNVSLERGREGLSAWQIGVLAVVRLGLDADYDRLQDLTHNHRNLRGLLGLGEWCDEGWSHRRIRSNLALLDNQTIHRLNELVAKAGYRVLGVESAHHVRIDSFVVETNTHYPSDSAQLIDGARKILSIGNQICSLSGLTLFRQHASLLKKMKKSLRSVLSAGRRRGKNREKALKEAYTHMLAQAEHICDLGLQLWDQVGPIRSTGALTPCEELALTELLEQMNYFLTGTAHVANLAKRRVLEEESIPHDARLYSLFEPHAELINRGKMPHPYQLGHRCYVVEDEFGFIVDYDVMKNGEQDVDALPRIAERLTQDRPENDPLSIISCDRGFHSPGNQKIVADACEHPNLHAKGNPAHAKQWAEDTELYRKARNRHAGIESCIGALVSANGLKRCRDRGRKNYHTYVGLGVLGRNLTTLGRHLIAQNNPETAADLSDRLPPLAA